MLIDIFVYVNQLDKSKTIKMYVENQTIVPSFSMPSDFFAEMYSIFRSRKNISPVYNILQIVAFCSNLQMIHNVLSKSLFLEQFQFCKDPERKIQRCLRHALLHTGRASPSTPVSTSSTSGAFISHEGTTLTHHIAEVHRLH